MRLGVRVGLASNIRAAVPATSGAAIDVPLSIICLRVGLLLTCTSNEGFCDKKKIVWRLRKDRLVTGSCRFRV